MTTPNIQSADIAVKHERVLSAAIPLHPNILNVLTQVRREMHQPETDELVESVLTRGQFVPGRVVALKPAEAKKYVAEVNELWSTKHRLTELKPCVIDGQTYYLVVIYGHRRLAACKRALHAIESEGRTSRHFHGAYLCDIYFGLNLRDVIPMQLVENQYVPVSRFEEVVALWRYWRYVKRYEPDMCVAEFARRVGRKPDWVRDMLRFTALPEAVQVRADPDYRGGAASYTLLLQVARLVEAHERFGQPLSDREIVQMVNWLVVKRVRVRDFALEVTERIAHLVGKQGDLFAREPISERIIRRTAAGGLVQALIAHLHYIKVIHDMMRDGSFGSLSPYASVTNTSEPTLYSPDSPARMAARVLRELRTVVPDLAQMIERDGKSRQKIDLMLHDLGMTYAVFSSIVAGDDS